MEGANLRHFPEEARPAQVPHNPPPLPLARRRRPQGVRPSGTHVQPLAHDLALPGVRHLVLVAGPRRPPADPEAPEG